jgi:exopolysaccharide biosynthesis polyprenyl glycosylphosphotransferase
MIRLRHKLLILALRALDQAIGAAWLLVFMTRAEIVDLLMLPIPSAAPFQTFYCIVILAAFATSTVIFHILARYDVARYVRLPVQLLGTTLAAVISTVVFFAASRILAFPSISIREFAIIGAGYAVTLAGLRIAFQLMLRALPRSAQYARHVLVIGYTSQSREFVRRILAAPELGYRVHGFVLGRGVSAASFEDEDRRAPAVLGSIDRLRSILEERTIDELILCAPFAENAEDILSTIKLGEELGIVVRVVLDPADRGYIHRMQFEYFGRDTVVTFFRQNLILQLALKRAIDVTLSAVLLVLLSPLLAVVAIVIKLTSPGPILFVQDRVGMNQRPFRLFKFRSMVADAEARKAELSGLNEMDGPVFKIRSDPRTTKIGRLLRKTSIDELPQLFNVLNGTMSLVGPRPPVPSEVEKYDWLYRRRLSIRPGITCLWQIYGRNELSFKQWMELDRVYVETWSLWLDIKILLRTVPVVLLCRGAS